MKEGKSKSKTLLIEDIESLKSSLLDFDGDVEVIAIVNSKGDELMELVRRLKNLKLFKIVPKPDPNLEGLIALDYHAVDPMKVTDAIFTDPDHMIFNGDVKIPWDTDKSETTVIGGYFLDEEVARTICREFNIHTAKRVDALADKLTRSQKFRKEIAENAMD